MSDKNNNKNTNSKHRQNIIINLMIIGLCAIIGISFLVKKDS